MATTEDEELLDPRVQVELEKLNTATDDINKLESQLEEANYVFRTTLTESTARLKALAKKLGGCIEKARPFYEAQELARSSQLDCQRAAVQYQRANALHQAAKETIALAEERFVNCRHEHWQFDSAWQEMLNHATMKVMEAEAQKAASEREHMRRAAAFTQAEQKVQQLQRGLRSSINKSLVYFEEKNNITAQLECQKERVQQLQRAISASKSSYAQSLRSLEQISEEIHEQRRCRMPREPGVGAELTPPEISDDRAHAGTSAKSFTPLEEMTAKEEKYWETLRQKLEKLQVKSENNCSTEEEVMSDLESPDGRERTVTGSSCVSNLELECSIEEERIVSGESSLGSESDGARSPTEEGQEMTLPSVETAPPDVMERHLEKSDGDSEKEDSVDIEEIEIDLDLGKVSAISIKEGQLPSKKDAFEISSASEDRVSFAAPLRTMGSSSGELDNEGADANMNKDASGALDNCFSDSEIRSSCRVEELPADDDDNVVLPSCYEKERGDGSSSPPPAMCQPTRHLSSIPECEEIH